MLAAATAAILPVAALAAANPAHAQDEGFADPHQAAASWLADQSEGASWSGGDVAVSLDAVIGLMAARVAGDQVQTTLEWLNEPDVLNAYVYPPSSEGEDAQLNAGGTGKVMYAVATAGGDPTDFGGIKLAEVLEDSRTDDGGYGDGAPLSNAWAVLGLSRTDDGVDDDAVAALTAAQCDDGGFFWDDADGGDDCTSDPDTTGQVAAALRAADTPEATEAFEDAAAWLESAQADNGAFDPGHGQNASSTSYAAQALLAAEQVEAAEQATVYLLDLQVPCGDDDQGAVLASEPEDPEFGEMMRVTATAQALVPLSGQNLADLDASDSAADVPAVECTSGGDDEAAADEDDGDDDSASWVPWVIGAAALILVAAVAFVIVRRRGTDATDSDVPAQTEEKDGE